MATPSQKRLNNMKTDTNQPIPKIDQAAVGGRPSTTCCVFLVFREHNRDGETLVETYNNREAAEQHVKHLDDTIDGWGNMVGGWIEEEEIRTTFSSHNAQTMAGKPAETQPESI